MINQFVKGFSHEMGSMAARLITAGVLRTKTARQFMLFMNTMQQMHLQQLPDEEEAPIGFVRGGR
jgi:hypothetical protein